MTLEVAYEFPHTGWPVAKIYDLVAKELETRSPAVKRINSSPKADGNPCSFYSPHMLTIKNPSNGRYIVVSYWDIAHELFYDICNWKPENCMGIFTSCGINGTFFDLNKKYNIPVFPISYCTNDHLFDQLSLTSIPTTKKPENKLFFRGFLYHKRKELAEYMPDNINGGRVDFEDYYNELNNNKINLSLNGVAEICYRDIEILGSRSVLLRPKLFQNLYNPLIPNVHYLDFEVSDNPKEQADIIRKKFNKVKRNTKLLTYISENGYKWFIENGTIEKNAYIITKLINLSVLI